MTLAMSAAEILRELVAIPTPSVVSNLPLLRWVAGFLEPRGWQVELLPYVDDSGVEKANLLARPGVSSSEGLIELAFVCHTDTVPFTSDWTGALILAERDGHLYGCGSCDVKGALACFLAAVSVGDSGMVSAGTVLILTADEEIGCKGMERLLVAEIFRGLRIASAIVCEPTSLRPGIAGKGYGLAQITVQGREAHSAFPHQGISAISIAARLITGIEDCFGMESTHSSGGTSGGLFDPPRTTVNIGVISGGTAKNILAGKCTFLVEWRAVPGDAPGDVLARIKAQAAGMEHSHPRATIEIEALRDEPGFSPVAHGPLQKRLAGLLAAEPVGISFSSEASRLARIAEEVIVMGPGDMRTAHSDRECVPIGELELWTHVLRDLLVTA